VIRLVEYATTRATLAPQDLDYLLDLVVASGKTIRQRCFKP
jgi:hypothetical protein